MNIRYYQWCVTNAPTNRWFANKRGNKIAVCQQIRQQKSKILNKGFNKLVVIKQILKQI